MVGTDLSRRELYLHTSPEFAMKKILASGETKIFAFTPVFRNREQGALHSPEFTMLEWYRANEPYRTLWDDCAAILKIAGETMGHSAWSFRDKTCDPAADFARSLSIRHSNDFADISLTDANRDQLAKRAQAAGIHVGRDDTWSDIFSRVVVEKIEPILGTPAPTILYEYPVSEAALARPVPRDPSVAERFELYACGVELANGFGELTDAVRAAPPFRNLDDGQNSRIYGERYPIDEDS